MSDSQTLPDFKKAFKVFKAKKTSSMERRKQIFACVTSSDFFKSKTDVVDA